MWVGYGQSLTGNSVEYAPYQSAAARFSAVPPEDFQKAVQYFSGDEHSQGAEAVFRLVANHPAYRWLLWLYQHLPGFAAITEFLYAFVAAHRDAGYRVTRILWGKNPVRPSYRIASKAFSRAIALIYVIAFASFGRQIRGLIGAQGIQPIAEFLSAVRQQFGSSAFWQAPTLFWWTQSEFGLLTIAWGGAVVAAVAAIGRPHTSGQKAAYVLLFMYYLSLVVGGQIFMGYQWDYLLLEAGFLVIFLKPVLTRVWLFQWLLFRLMFESGAVKLLSHDMSWHNLTALAYHYTTQPLPTPLAWYMYQLPMWFQKMSTLFTFAVELVLPFLIFGPRRLKQVVAFGTIFLETLILLTGNYTFFNLLTIALCLFLLDDALLLRLEYKPRSRKLKEPAPRRPLRTNAYVSGVLIVFVLIVSGTQLAAMFGFESPEFLRSAIARTAPFGLVNEYGLFANMTTTRPEISIEGSNDGADWAPYVFRYKPGPLNRAPGWVAPGQPRLDWQMWFAALGNYRENPWLIRFMERLLEGSIPVLQLIDQNPFGGKPPKYIRAMVYEYRFTNYDERRQTGNWWKRELKGAYFPPVSLRANNPAQ
jgi:hypothetical protein